jgi:hypothetical protein
VAQRADTARRGRPQTSRSDIATVRLRLWKSNGLRVEVRGPQRSQVEGLAQQLSEVLRRGAPLFHRFDIDAVVWGLLSPLILAGFFLGAQVPRWLGLAHKNGHWEIAEVLGPVIGVAIAALVLFGMSRAFPTVEVMAEGQLPRHRQMRKLILGACWAIALIFLSILIDHALS